MYTHKYQPENVFSVLVSRIFLIWCFLQDRTNKKAGTKNVLKYLKQYQMLTSVTHSPQLPCWCNIWCLSVIAVLFQMDGTSFCLKFMGEGYTTGQDPSQGKPNATISTEITGPGIVILSVWFDSKYPPLILRYGHYCHILQSQDTSQHQLPWCRQLLRCLTNLTVSLTSE